MATSFDFSKNKIPAKYKQNQSSKKAGVGELEYDDKRGESVAQLKLQEAANKSSSVRGLEDINNQANNSDNVTQLMSLQNTVNEPQSQEEAIHNQENPLQLKSSNDGVVQFGPTKPKLRDADVNKSHEMDEDADGKLTPKQITKDASQGEKQIDGAHGKQSTATGKEDTNQFPITPEIRLSSTLIQAMIQATHHSNNAKAMLPAMKSKNHAKVLPLFQKEMESINNLKETKGKVYTVGGDGTKTKVMETVKKDGKDKEQHKEITLSQLAGFNELYFDPTEYFPDEEMAQYKSEFKDGAGRLDNILDGKLSGVARDFGKIWMGERGATFFAPIQSVNEIISKAENKRGIYYIGDALKLGPIVFGWLDQSLPGGQISNPDHKIVKIYLAEDPFGEVVSQIPEIKAGMPKGTESGAYPGLWQPGGSVKNEDGKDTDIPKTKEVAISAMNIQEFIKYIDDGIFKLQTIPLAATVENANPEEEAKKLRK